MLRFVLSFLFVVSASAQSQTASEDQPIRCEFETTIKLDSKPVLDRWTYSRSSNIVAHSRPARSEVWTQMSNQIALEQWFHEHRVVLESTPGDLRAAGAEVQWNALTGIIPSELLSKLTRKGTKKIAGYQAERFRGKIGATDWEVWWIPELRLPGKIVQKTGKQKIGTVLKRVSQARIESPPNDYRRIDYADLGDLEHDPVVQQVLRESNRGTHKH